MFNLFKRYRRSPARQKLRVNQGFADAVKGKPWRQAYERWPALDQCSYEKGRYAGIAARVAKARDEHGTITRAQSSSQARAVAYLGAKPVTPAVTPVSWNGARG